MRCVNCGWDNQPGVTRCVKCGQPVGPSVYGESHQSADGYAPRNDTVQSRPTVVGAGQPATPRPTVVGANQPVAPRPTVVGAAGENRPQPRPTMVMNSAGQQPTTQAMAGGPARSGGNCPSCGYPLTEGATSCPMCHTAVEPSKSVVEQSKPTTKNISHGAEEQLAEFNADQKVKCQNCGTEVTMDFTFCPSCGQRIHLPTMKGLRHIVEKPKHKCSLELVPEEGEEVEVLHHHYTGDKIVLNRDNTEPSNRTITSKEQAVLSFSDGKWYIENSSEMASTYLKILHKQELVPGDVIVLGDRSFRFNPE